jgi:O-antigen ligase
MVLSIFIINLFVVSVYFGIERVKDRVAQTNSVQETQDEIVQEAYPIISDFPIFGSGGGSFHSTFPSYQLSEAGAFNEHLHNDNLQFLIEYGVVGYFILFSIFGFSIYKSIRALHSRRNSIFKGSAFACLMVLIGMALHMSIDYPLQGYANASYFVVFLALCMVINTLTLQQTKQRSRTI